MRLMRSKAFWSIAILTGLAIYAQLYILAIVRPMIIYETDKQVTVKPGKHLKIKLRSNAITGYTWQVVSYDDLYLERIGTSIHEAIGKDDKQQVGSPTYQVFEFKALGPGDSRDKI